jgi:uncharacterized protein YbcV (DUF1398 family)
MVRAGLATGSSASVAVCKDRRAWNIITWIMSGCERFYSADGEMMTTSINYEGLPPVAPEFDAAALRANILDSQRNGQPYREFTRRAMAGGVQGYITFLRGKRVTYWGRTGDQHTEWFPGSGPAKVD